MINRYVYHIMTGKKRLTVRVFIYRDDVRAYDEGLDDDGARDGVLVRQNILPFQ